MKDDLDLAFLISMLIVFIGLALIFCISIFINSEYFLAVSLILFAGFWFFISIKLMGRTFK